MFAVGGNAGFAIGLLFVSAALIAAGVRGTAFLAVPAVITGVIVYLVLIRKEAAGSQCDHERGSRVCWEPPGEGRPYQAVAECSAGP